jgi:hypothetical protein
MANRVRPGIEQTRQMSGTSTVRIAEWDSIRGTHQGQRPSEPHQQAGHKTAPDPSHITKLQSPLGLGRFLAVSLNCLRHGHAHGKRLMRADVVVLPEPLVDDDLGLAGRDEPLGIEHLSAQRAIEPLVVAILPR